jgi:hypothetical protein
VELAQNPPHEEDSDEQCGGAAGDGHERGEEAKANLLARHQPLAWSRISAVNGREPGGAIWKDSAQRPTMTSAGAERE